MFKDVEQILENLFGISGDVFVKRKNISPANIETCNGVIKRLGGKIRCGGAKQKTDIYLT